MRVLVTRGRRRDKDEEGAVAILVAIMAVLILVLSAFVVDLGAAYNSKRQLQTAADSSALAAAAVYAKYPGTCAQLIANAAYEAEAQAAADDYRERNRPDSTGGDVVPSCNDDGELEVGYDASGSTDYTVGRLATDDDSLTTSRDAAATVDVASKLNIGLRPMALCSAALPPNDVITDSVFRVDYPGDGTRSPATCPKPSTPGNWWTVDCPGERTGSTGTLQQQILEGCPDPVEIIPGQDTADTPLELSVVLEDACPSAPVGSSQCMSGDPGALDSGHIEDSWKTLAETHTPVVMPVFCVPPQCSEDTTDGTGTTSVFPVYKLAAMIVCGYHFDKAVRYQNLTGKCATTAHDVYADDTKDNYILVVYTRIQTSGSTTSSECALGSSCDGGLRRVHLSQ